MTPWHLGPVHPLEQVLTLVLAVGPFLVLGVVVWLRRRAEAREDAEARAEGVGPVEPVEPGEPYDR